MNTKPHALIICLLGLPLLLAQGQGTSTTATTPATTAAAPTATPPPPPQLSETEQTIKDIKNPLPWLSWGADLRIREEYFDNILTLNPHNPLHLQSYMRFRSRLWASVTPIEDVSFNVRLANEAREWFLPAGYTAFKYRIGTEWKNSGMTIQKYIPWVTARPLTVRGPTSWIPRA